MLYFLWKPKSFGTGASKRRQKYLQKMSPYILSILATERRKRSCRNSLWILCLQNRKLFYQKSGNFKTNSWTAVLKSMALFDLSEKEILFFIRKRTWKSIEKNFKIKCPVHSLPRRRTGKNLKQYLENKLALSSYDAENYWKCWEKIFIK